MSSRPQLIPPLFLLGAVLVLLTGAAQAQGSAASAAPKRSAARGDTVHLKGGGTIQGVQVLRVGTFIVEVRTLKDLPPLILPKSQVTRIDYDDIDPAAEDAAEGKAEKADVPAVVVVGTKLSKEFDRKLFAPLPETSLRIDNQDFLSIVKKLASDLGIPLEIAAAVRAIPARERLWSAELEPGASFITLLREDLFSAFPGLRIVLRYDGITLTTRAAEAAVEG